MDAHVEGVDRQVITRRALLSLLANRQQWPFGFSFKGYPNWPLEKAFALTAQLGYTQELRTAILIIEESRG